MATIKFVRGDQREFVSVAEQVAATPELKEVVERLAPGELQASTFVHHRGAVNEPQLFEVRFPPETRIEPHAHDADEIIVVVDGEIHFGKQVYGIGSSVFIPKMTLYSFQAGPDGVTFLNFRPTLSQGVLRKDELMARRKSGAVEAG